MSQSVCTLSELDVSGVYRQIIIDSIEIAVQVLQDHRASLTIIPPDTAIFSGTLRFNLDRRRPNMAYAELAHLKKFVAELPDGLMHMISEAVDN
uniref:Uncharacterized protein n=1 Tax=Caenorhabditis japonica TaxID=281687 RepID=A0A8R1E4J2_CAEJA